MDVLVYYQLYHLNTSSLTLENTKSACKKHFDIGSYMECYVLGSERGPSYTSIEQIKSRCMYDFTLPVKQLPTFIMDQEDEADGDGSIPSTSFQWKKPKKEWSVPVQKSPKKVIVGSAYPKSVPLSSRLKLGKIIPPKCNQDIIELHVEELYIDHAYTV